MFIKNEFIKIKYYVLKYFDDFLAGYADDLLSAIRTTLRLIGNRTINGIIFSHIFDIF